MREGQEQGGGRVRHPTRQENGSDERTRKRLDRGRLLQGRLVLPGRASGHPDRDRLVREPERRLSAGARPDDSGAEKRVHALNVSQGGCQLRLGDVACQLGDQGELNRIAVHVEIDGLLEGTERAKGLFNGLRHPAMIPQNL
ncbi:hypothetical protein GCM10025867_11170 [Frondihabitans sucicola]|uniref:PilZ domain-containing protein n=1 Tax=Frondihabitans sucicola TaxID=1268041 RepID=A0ABM8GKF3_9MICO|nr:hypothetical protein [Frondihabitans sucicola]BDZ48876.1 hypothetical protein GCM10025867_11170 [Frondihabitans sucicola]